MSLRENEGGSSSVRRDWFTTTHWSVVLSARATETPKAGEALEKLCRTYWPPLYSYLRRDGYSTEDAQDLTQEFFARLLEKNYLSHLRHQEGKFRSFLLTFLKHFLSDQRGDKELRDGARAVALAERAVAATH